MNPERIACVLYVTATCNLKCKYCYIDKSPILVSIDKILEDSYQGDYYFDFMKKMFCRDKLQRIEFWGGEPTYGLCRAQPTVEQAINYFPNLNELFFSTNLTTEQCVDDIINFCKIAQKFPERHLDLRIQLSLDGPQYINDFNRGEGVTVKFTKNFNKLLFAIKDFLKSTPNLHISAHFKPTLDAFAIHHLQTKEAIIEYFQFLDTYKKLADSIMGNFHPQWFFTPSIPNTATPSPHTTQEGKEFANMCKLINEVENEMQENPIFYYYSEIMPFTNGAMGDCYDLCRGCGTCGTGSLVVGLLPNNMISGCHNGFTELLEEYKKHAPEQTDYQIDTNLFKYREANSMIFTEEEYAVYERQTKAFNLQAKFQISESAMVIQKMAMLKQIDEKYQDLKEAVAGAHFIQRVTSSCLRDNLGVSGSRYLFQLGFARLFLNGAKEEIQKHVNNFSRPK